MNKGKDTEFILNELNKSTSLSQSLKVIGDNANVFTEKSFSVFFSEYLGAHDELDLADIINASGLERKYGYAVVGGTRKGSRDKIIALCFAAKMKLNEIQHALKYSGQNELYVRNRRDAIIVAKINQSLTSPEKYGNVTELNLLLDQNGQEPLEVTKL